MARNGLIVISLIGILVGAMIVCISVFWGHRETSSLQIGVLAGVIVIMLALLPLVWMIWKSKTAPSDAETERIEFEKAAQQATQELRRQTEILQQRERKLADRFLQYQTWMEYPIADEREAFASVDEDESTHPHAEAVVSVETRVTQERALNELLEQEAETAFHKIKANAYTVNGRFDLELVRDDLRQLIIKVARIYHPESTNPLLETSLEQLLRAASRTCLQLLVLVERIPINLSEFNLQNLYTYLRRGLKAYQVYQNVRPLLPYFHYASYAGRIILGSNPISLGAQWAIWKLGSKGATAATRHLVNRQALSFLHDSITIIGFEVAGIYDSGLRHRDRFWILGIELTELLSRFPLSREAIVRAFAEIGSCPLRSEYDRVFLYRCIAAHRSGGPQRFAALEQLSKQDRQWVAKRLGSFANQHLAHRDTERLGQWKSDVEKRLGIAIDIDHGAHAHSEKDQLWAAAQSLVEFLIVERQQDIEEIDHLLDRSQVFEKIKRSDRDQLLNGIKAEPPGIYELPDLDPQGDQLAMLITDMSRLSAATVWQIGGSLDAIEWAGEFFRIEPKKLLALVQEGYREELSRRVAQSGSIPKLTVEQITAILETVPPEESILAIFPEPRFEWGTRNPPPGRREGQFNMLVAWAQRIVVIELGADVRLVWTNDQSAQVTIEKGLLQTVARITGGEWLTETPHPQAIQFSRSLTSRHDYDFDLLQRLISRSAPSS